MTETRVDNTLAPEEIRALLKAPSAAQIKDGKVLLADSPEEMHADIRPDAHVMDRRFWSVSRRADYAFYEKELAGESRDAVFLDVGAGTGLFREIFSQFKYIGLDLYPYHIVTLVADIRRELPLANATCDIVMLSNVLEHTPTPHVLLAECFRVLKPGGRLIGTVPFIAHVHQEPYDYFRYTHHMLERMMEEVGFNERMVLPLEKPVDFYEWARGRFFDALLYRTPLSKIEKFFAWLAYYLVKATNLAFRPVFLKAGQSYQLARRFGFLGRKPS